MDTLRRKIPVNHALKSASFIDIALQITKEDNQARTYLGDCRYDSPVSILRNCRVESEGDISSIGRATKASVQVSPAAAQGASVMVRPAQHPEPRMEDLLDERNLLMNVFSSKERKLFVHKTARVLFTTEFVMLTEYTEIIVPLIYCTYTLKSLDEVGLHEKIDSVLTYTALEFVSLLTIGYVIQRKQRISMLRLISFVLDKGWRMVQANLCLWISFTIESSLEHSGKNARKNVVVSCMKAYII
ncbi:hypothetical protein PHYSODRAFT_301677 [Phytophthora sojae]|uniref:Uncharacterized protein n=1 Tax=Phytophthora sojae (strain P6497) TaxID=1094619 RepID=G4ZKY1_PHYSP|nr:hypothetical protein PHYSODRAFT_301677 [Phytophthora sojae]EGZ14899.1 hypothetical protein PHYSODRAFT_301677 [Phytophthora sojae]|eukprot:XP_009528648.1 hypothetical protein PHYSODRAFT_301677 [Phytophthora sojae]